MNENTACDDTDADDCRKADKARPFGGLLDGGQVSGRRARQVAGVLQQRRPAATSDSGEGRSQGHDGGVERGKAVCHAAANNNYYYQI